MLGGLREVIEVGMLEVLWTPAVPWLFIPSWLCVVIGIFIQLRCLKKGKAKWFIAFLAAALILSEVLCQVITGWDVLIFLILYGLFLYLLLGAAIGTAIYYLKRRKKLRIST